MWEGNGPLNAKGTPERGEFAGFELDAAGDCVQAEVQSQHSLSACPCCARQHTKAISSTL